MEESLAEYDRKMYNINYGMLESMAQLIRILSLDGPVKRGRRGLLIPVLTLP